VVVSSRSAIRHRSPSGKRGSYSAFPAGDVGNLPQYAVTCFFPFGLAISRELGSCLAGRYASAAVSAAPCTSTLYCLFPTLHGL